MRHKLILVVLIFHAVARLAFAQTGMLGYNEILTVRKTIGVNSQDTVWFSLPGFYGSPFTRIDTASGFNLTDKLISEPVRWTGNGAILLKLISGSAADSMRVRVVSVVRTNFANAPAVQFCANTAHYIIGSSSGYDATAGNGNAGLYPLSGFMNPSHALAIIPEVGDLTGGNRRFEIALIIN